MSAAKAAPIITLTSDFGTRDPFVGVMKGVILGIAPDAVLVDLTHEVPPQDVRTGAHYLRAAVPHFPRGTIHLAVVDPTVGTRRRALVIETRRAFFVVPDNGIASLAVSPSDVVGLYDVSRSRYRLRPLSRTFHGRDVFAALAGRLAAGMPPADLGRPVRGMVRLREPAARRSRGALHGRVLFTDRFGNLITNVTRADLAGLGAFRGAGVSVTIDGRELRLRSSYAAAPVGGAVALVNSADLLEIAVNCGAAAAVLGVGPGARISVRRN